MGGGSCQGTNIQNIIPRGGAEVNRGDKVASREWKMGTIIETRQWGVANTKRGVGGREWGVAPR